MPSEGTVLIKVSINIFVTGCHGGVSVTLACMPYHTDSQHKLDDNSDSGDNDNGDKKKMTTTRVGPFCS